MTYSCLDFSELITVVVLSFSGLLSEHVQAVEWEKTQLQELDITGTDLTSECLSDLLTRVPALRWLSAGQQDGFNDSVLHQIFPCTPFGQTLSTYLNCPL